MKIHFIFYCNGSLKETILLYFVFRDHATYKDFNQENFIILVIKNLKKIHANKLQIQNHM
uniref:Uncharacterized protein n=1 Tax=Aegilops tauschii subsp. strangulata TaxID=200361 RepID=A0A453BR02_AEGTS